MKKWLFLLLFLLMAGNAWAACSGSSPNLTAADCTHEQVQACITAAADGDTINIPAGACTWDTAVTINSSGSRTKMVKLVGAGTDASTGTRITANIAGPDPILYVWLDRRLSRFEMSNIRFIQNIGYGTGTNEENVWGIQLAGNADTYDSIFRVHDCVFVEKAAAVQNSVAVGYAQGLDYNGSPDNGHPYIWGLFDNVTWTGTLSFQAVDVNPKSDVGSDGNDIMGCSSDCNYGHLAWRDWTVADHQGTWKNVIFEDCTWTATGVQTQQAALDSGVGGAWVVRYSTFRNNWLSGHGPDAIGSARGTKWTEVYNNEFITDESTETWIMANGFKSGTGVNFNNTYWDASHKGTGNPKSITGNKDFTAGSFSMITYRRAHGTGAVYGAKPCQAVACGDETSTTCDNKDNTTDPAKGYICWDMTGAKRGANDAGRTLGYSFSSEPVYFWNNKWSDTATAVTPSIYEDDGVDNVADYLQADRDYIVSASTAKPGYTPYGDYVGGRYYHELRGMGEGGETADASPSNASMTIIAGTAQVLFTGTSILSNTSMSIVADKTEILYETLKTPLGKGMTLKGAMIKQ